MNGNNNFDCRNAILSNEYVDLLVRYRENLRIDYEDIPNSCLQIINYRYAVLHQLITSPELFQNYNFTYVILPKLYGLMDTSSLEEIGVNRLRRLNYVDLYGQGTIIGFIDTGIDYTLNVFRNADNTTRVSYIWDQTIQTGTAPDGFLYGSEYTSEMINEALQAEQPLDIVPSTDTNGHGSFMAGIAAGNIDRDNDFSGVAPQADIAVVKLKPAKQNLRDYFYIKDEAVCYQETDIMMGVKYLLQKAEIEGKPLIICLGIGTNSGGHDGSGILDEYLNDASSFVGTCAVVPAGNEANVASHYRSIEAGNEYEDVELRVGENEKGFALELWAQAPSVYSIAIISPSGEYVERIPPRVETSHVIRFIFEKTIIFVNYRIIEKRTGDELIFLRFDGPTPGIWTIRVFKDVNFQNYFDMWLPIKEFIGADTHFLKPDPDITITGPGTSDIPITVAAYNHINDSIYLNSGRGFTRTGNVKPTITAPGVNVYGPLLNNTFGTRSGTSIAAAHVAGAVSLLFQWGIVNNGNAMDSNDIKALLIKGADRRDIPYPNNVWGYGTLNVFGSFDSLRTTLG